MLPLLFVCLFILATSAQRLRQRQGVGRVDGLDSLLPLQYSITATATIASSTGAAGAGVTGTTATAYPTLTGSAASAESAAIASEDALFAAQDSFYATAYPALTGSAAAAESAAFAAEESYYLTAAPVVNGQAAAANSTAIASKDAAFGPAYPPLTGSAAAAESAAFATFNSGDNYYATVGPLTGSAVAAESAYIIAEDSYYATAFPALTGSAAVAESAAFASEDNYYATAFPVTGSVAAAYSATLASAVPSGSVKDACGPEIPDSTVPDSCNTPVEQVSAPAAWGVQCLNDTGSSTPINITICAPLIQKMCSNQWQNLGEWNWLTGQGCSVGSFLPPRNFNGSAPGPTKNACEELIYASMVDDCQLAGVPWNLAGVNVKVFPANGYNGGSGEAVNVGYGSYIVAGRQLRSYSDSQDCTYIPPDDYCRGSRCYPPRPRGAKCMARFVLGMG